MAVIAHKNRDLMPYWPLGLIALVIVVALVLSLILPRLLSSSPEPVAEVEPTTTVEIPKIDLVRLEQALQKSGHRPAASDPELDVFLANPVFDASTGRTAPPEALTQPSVVFRVTETIHTGILPTTPAVPVVSFDGQQLEAPFVTRTLAESEHHRLTLEIFPLTRADGTLVDPTSASQMKVEFPPEGGPVSPDNVLTWDLPITYTDEFTSDIVAHGMPGPELVAPDTGGLLPSFTWGAILAIMAGMLVALSPCLLGLALYYASVLANASGDTSDPARARAARTHIIQTGIYFAVGFIAVYTAGGAAAGLVGQSLQHLGLLTTWIRPISMGAGAIILVLAVRTAWNARSPVVCKMPLGGVFGKPGRTGPLASAIMGFTFAGGCLSCFSATVLPALLLYASSLGSVTYGALLLLVFSLGISIPVLGLALGVSRMRPVIDWLQRNNAKLGLVSAAVMAGFGVLMVTYQYHTATGLLGGWLGL